MPLYCQIDRNVLYRPLEAKLVTLAEACEARGAEYWLTCGYRSFSEQAAEYAKGRTVLKDSAGNPQGIVTKAVAGQSMHNYTIATDWTRNFAPGTHKLRPLWPQQKPEHYQILAEEARKLDLEPGFEWHFQDPPHVQLPIGAHGITLKMLQDAYKAGGIPQVHVLLDAHGPW